MKKLVFAFLAICLISLSRGQTSKFVKHVDINFGALRTVETYKDSGFILGSSKNFEQYFIRKTDIKGNVLWVSELPVSGFDYPEDHNLAVVNNSIIFASRTYIDDSSKIFMRRFTSDGEVLWTREFGTASTTFRFIRVLTTTDNKILVVSLLKDSTGFAGIANFYFDEDGNYLQQKRIHSPLPAIFTPSSTVTNDGKIVVTIKNSIVKFTQDGDSIWSKNSFQNLKYIRTAEDNNLLAAQANGVYKLDSLGNLIWSKNLSSNIKTISALNSNYIIHTNDKGFVYNSSGNLIRQFDFYLFSLFTVQKQNYLIYCGSDWFGISDSTGRLNFAIYNNYSRKYLFSIFSTFNFSFFSHDVEFINLEYSADYGATWISIIRYWPISNQSFSWTVPATPSDSCLLRFTDSYDSTGSFVDDSLYKIRYTMEYDYISINEIRMWIGNNGDGSHDPFTGGNGFYWPGGENATQGAIYEDGLVWGGKLNGEIRVNGNTHRQGIRPGNIISQGVAGDPTYPLYGIRKIRRFWEYLPPGIKRDRFEHSYLNWPGDLGAPFIDTNNDGVFTNGIDKPKFVGDEALFYVANDLDTAASTFTYGSYPIGLEFQTTVFGFNKNNFLKDVVFKKYRVINKSGYDLLDFYFGFWTDDDMGSAEDDFVGCDTVLNLAFTYNGNDNDVIYGTPPPAVGHLLVAGPISPASPSDSARFGDGFKKGFINSPLTAFVFFIGGSPIYRDPRQGNYTGTLELYNYLMGRVWNGDPFIDPTTNSPTKFLLYGDPELGQGWYEGPSGWPGGYQPSDDRRFLMSSGPFNFAAGDTQEVVFAIYMAKGTNYLNSVTKIKELAPQIVNFYNGEFITSLEDDISSTPMQFSLGQNYPNPFNPETKIKFSIPAGVETRRGVSLRIYDILGNEVATLVNEIKPAGEYEVKFNASRLSSGIYFYQLRARDFVETKKMILLR